MTWENSQKYVGFSSLFNLIWFFSLTVLSFKWVCFAIRFLSIISNEILFGFLSHVLIKWCLPRCFLCRCPLLCVCSVFSWESKHLSCVFGEAVAVQCDSCQLEMCFLLQQPVERSSSHSSDDHPEKISACVHWVFWYFFSLFGNTWNICCLFPCKSQKY